MFACMNRLINFDFNNMHKQALGDLRHVVVIVVIGFVLPSPYGARSLQTRRTIGSIWRDMWTLSLEWNGARFHAQALTTEAVGDP